VIGMLRAFMIFPVECAGSLRSNEYSNCDLGHAEAELLTIYPTQQLAETRGLLSQRPGEPKEDNEDALCLSRDHRSLI
jgi:hypothetical protein